MIRSAAPVAATLAAIVAAIGVLATGCREREVGHDARQAPGSSVPTATRILYSGAQGSFVDLVAGARHGVVGIRAAMPVKSGPAAMFPGAPETTADVALGTGFLIEAKGIYVVTTRTIATASTELRVALPDRSEVPAKLVGDDLRLDIALLSIQTEAQRLAPLPLGDSNHLAVGEWVVVLGNAFGDDVTASAGIVSATGREGAGSLVAGRQHGFRTFIQTDARIHRGNSGGPVLDTAGQVIGLAIATGDRPGELSFALPIERVREAVIPLRDKGSITRSWLGARVLPVSPAQVEALGLPAQTGALVTEVEPSSPAIRAALRPGDVILAWDGRAVDHRALPWIVAQTAVGKAVPVTLWRNRAEFKLTVVTEAMPE